MKKEGQPSTQLNGPLKGTVCSRFRQGWFQHSFDVMTC